ncbi:MAG TPA: DNA polymerase IV [Candidatus Hydrogenedentes bacterium]|nr:DNA polymerase IV [Candidatus Hydrogenedentota bacterium]
MVRCIFHVDLDAFFVSVEQLHDPSLKGRPVVVGGHPDSRGVVSAASYEARRYGVHSAMPLVQAKRLCPQAVFVPVSFPKYVEASRRFMALVGTMASVVEPLGLDEAFLDVSDVVPDFAAARAHALELKRRVRDELGLIASVGVATCKIVAKVASDFDKPDGLVVVQPGEEASFLAPLDVQKLPGVGKKTADGLAEIGVHTIGQLAALPQEVLQRRLGRYGLLLLSLARGIDDSPVEPRGEAKSVSRETTFARDTHDIAHLDSTLQAICVEVAHDLRENRKRARTVTLKLRYEDFQTVTRQSTLNVDTVDPQVLHDAAASLLRTLMAGERRRIRLIGVRASRLSGPERQLDMFSQDTAKMQNLERAIAQLHDRFGPKSIQTLREREKKAEKPPRTT